MRLTVLKKIVFVDRFVIYSTEMVKELQKIIDLDIDLIFLGPNKNFPHKQSDQKISKSLRLWGKNDFVKKIFQYSRKEQVDLIHFAFEMRTFGNLKSALKFPLLLLMLKFSKANRIVTIRNIMIYRDKSKWLLFDDIPFQIPNVILKLLAKLYIKSICGFSNHIIVESNQSRSGLIEFFKINPSKVSKIDLGVSKFSNSNSQEIKYNIKDKSIILCFGVLSPRKNLDIVIRAFYESKYCDSNHVLVIAGSATDIFKKYELNLKELCKKLGIEKHVLFTGFLEESEINYFFQNAIMAIYDYKPMPGATGAILFAIQHQIPCIVSKIETFSDILNESEAVFVNPNSVIELTEGIDTICTDLSLQTRLKEKMKKKQEELSWKNAAKKHLEVYNKILKK
jgi:glycosyltransferase involved in cell wall biosynthesis